MSLDEINIAAKNMLTKKLYVDKSSSNFEKTCKHEQLLLTAYEVWLKVMFSQASLILSTTGGSASSHHASLVT